MNNMGASTKQSNKMAARGVTLLLTASVFTNVTLSKSSLRRARFELGTTYLFIRDGYNYLCNAIIIVVFVVLLLIGIGKERKDRRKRTWLG